jgi:hypothetical protein
VARIRSIHPGAPIDEDVASMSIHARYVWAFLPCHADRDGRLKDSPFTLKVAILPGDDVDMDALLGELAARQMIVRYRVGGRRFIQIRSFGRYQNPHKKEAASVCPPPSQHSETTQDPEITRPDPEITGPVPVEDGTSPAVRSDPDPGPIQSDPIDRARGDEAGEPAVLDLCRLFGKVRAREVSGLEWQGVPGENASRRAAVMHEQLDANPALLADVEPTMALLFKNAHRGDYAKAGEILKSASFAFAVWCTEFPALVEQLRGIAPARRAARSAVASTDRRIAELRSHADKVATPEELAELRSLRGGAGAGT